MKKAGKKMNKKIYGELLRKTVPTVITNEKEYERTRELFAKLINKQRSPE
jgi:hypothetical protein